MCVHARMQVHLSQHSLTGIKQGQEKSPVDRVGLLTLLALSGRLGERPKIGAAGGVCPDLKKKSWKKVTKIVLNMFESLWWKKVKKW